MPKLELTDKACKRKPIPGQQLDLIDTLAKGLVLRISPGRDVRAWRFHYRWQGERKMLPLGHYPDTALVTARELAKDARIKLAAGIDPAAPARAAAVTVTDLINSYVRLHASTKRTASKIERRLRKNVEALIGDVKLAVLHRRDITRCLDAVQARGSMIESARVFQDASSMCRWATARGDLDRNPMEGMRLPAKSTPKERVLTPEEIKHVWARLPHEPMGESLANCLKLILATAQRPGEVSGIAMEELDLAAKLWVIPPERHKSAKEHVVPLSAFAVRLIEQQRAAVIAHAAQMEREPGPWLFPSYRRTRGASQTFGPLLSGGLSHAVQRRGEPSTTMGIPRWTAHDLRRSAATHMEEAGTNAFIVAHVLGHISVTKASVTSLHYAKHDYLTEKRAALDAWGKRLSTMVDERSRRNK